VTAVSREALERLYDAFGRGDMEAVGAWFTDDIAWRVNGPSPVAGSYEGPDAVFAFFGRMMDQYEGTLRVDVTSMVADEQHGFVGVRESATRPDEVTYGGVHAWRFRDGRCCGFESFYDDSYRDFWTSHSVETPSGGG
jgi:ketosteroid isomerase-like protein